MRLPRLFKSDRAEELVSYKLYDDRSIGINRDIANADLTAADHMRERWRRRECREGRKRERGECIRTKHGGNPIS